MDLELMRNAELQEAFNEFDKARLLVFILLWKWEKEFWVRGVEIFDSGDTLSLAASKMPYRDTGLGENYAENAADD